MSKFLKRGLPVLVIVALLVVALLPSNNAKPAKAQDPVTIRIFVGVGTGYLPEQQAAQVALADEWNAAHEDIKIEFEFHDNETARDELLTQVSGGDVPAIVGPAGVRTVFEVSDLWADITSYIERDGDQLNLDDFDATSFGLYQLGDRQIAIPLGVYPSFIYVNETLFADAEVELPPTEYGAWTYEDLRATAMAVTQDANGVYNGEEGFDPAAIEVYGYYPFWTNFRASTIGFSPDDAGVLIGEDGTVTATFNQDAFRQAVKFFHDGIFVDHFIPNADAEGAIGEGVTNPFTSNRIAMGRSHTWLFGGIKSAMDDGNFTADWNVYPVPAAPNGKITAAVHADTFAIMDGFENKDAAWEVLKWLTAPEQALALCQVYGCMPARLSVRSEWESYWLEAFPFLNLDVVYGALEYLDAPNHEGFMPNYARAWDALEAFWQVVRSDPAVDTDAGLDALNAEVQGIFDEAAAAE